MINKKIEFLKESITDCQSNIRSIDVKIAAILAGLVAPLSIFDKIDKLFSHLSNLNPVIFCFEIKISAILYVVLAFFWIASVAVLIFGISAIHNPSKHILRLDNTRYTGSFYGANLFETKLIDAFYNRKKLTSKKDLDEIQSSLPSNESSFLDELSFEYLKLIYIRDIKYLRLNMAIRFAALGLLTLVISLIWKAST